MLTLCRAYTSAHDAEKAIERLLSAGVPGTGIQLLMGDAITDARDAPIGTFAGTTTAGALTVGWFADVAHSGREATGSFAGDRGKRRRGAFGDADRDTVTRYEAGVKRTRIASHDRLRKILVEAGLDQAIAAANVRALHAGRVLVLVRSASPPDEVAAVIDDLDRGPGVQAPARAAA